MTTTQTIYGYEVPIDSQGRVNLTELYRMAGKPPGKEPSRYKRLKRARAFLLVAGWYAVRGRASWAKIILAGDYVNYLGLKPAPEPRSKFDELWEKHQRWIADQDRQKAEWEAGQEERDRQHQEAMDAFDRIIDFFTRMSEDNSGEEWKGADYNSDTAGEEWKSAGADDSEAEPTAEPTGDGCGPDHLFTDFIDLPGFLRIRASVN